MGTRLIQPPKRRFLSLDQQAARLRALFPGFKIRLSGGPLEARGHLHPAPACAIYEVRIEYRWGHPPRVFVISPMLVCNREGEAPPHRFSSPGNPLCLYYGKDNEWSAHSYIAETIVPWTCEYLLFYELWQASGIWWGGGVDHLPKEGEDNV